MHIHGNSMNINPANFYSAGQNQKAAASRAAEVRKKLLKGAFQIEDGTTPEETLTIRQWTNSPHSRIETQDEYQAGAAGRDTDFD